MQNRWSVFLLFLLPLSYQFIVLLFPFFTLKPNTCMHLQVFQLAGRVTASTLRCHGLFVCFYSPGERIIVWENDGTTWHVCVCMCFFLGGSVGISRDAWLLLLFYFFLSVCHLRFFFFVCVCALLLLSWASFRGDGRDWSVLRLFGHVFFLWHIMVYLH